MTKIERRRAVVPLHHGNYEPELADLLDRVMRAQRDEETGVTPKRSGTKSEAIRLAKEYDAKQAEAEDTAVKVTVWALAWDDWSLLADEHPPRDDIAANEEAGIAAKTFPDDKQRGLNMKTFPPALLRAALVASGEADDVADAQAKGAAFLNELDPSRIHYAKLETAAWNVNVGDDALPKFSLVSLLKQQRDPDSKEPNASE